MITLKKVLQNEHIQAYIRAADQNFASMGYKEHGFRHAQFTAKFAGLVLDKLRYRARDSELARIAGYLHDIGNAVSRTDHAQNGAILVLDALEDIGLPYDEIFKVLGAVGSHEDKHMDPPTAIAAAVILGDKSDVHHTRIRTQDFSSLDIHAKVNCACQRSYLKVSAREKKISLELDIDEKVCSVMDYFEIFLERTRLCQKASRFLGCEFELFINGDKLL
jgi:putative nucleotidyltransferase with HDIG domain